MALISHNYAMRIDKVEAYTIRFVPPLVRSNAASFFEIVQSICRKPRLYGLQLTLHPTSWDGSPLLLDFALPPVRQPRIQVAAMSYKPLFAMGLLPASVNPVPHPYTWLRAPPPPFTRQITRLLHYFLHSA
jgi:hypothetical protein